MYMKHPTVVPDGGDERIGRTPAWNVGLDPCPHCGGASFTKVTRETKHLELSDDGTLHGEAVSSELLEVWCRDCDTRLA